MGEKFAALRWCLRIACRQSRNELRRFFLIALPIVVGVGSTLTVDALRRRLLDILEQEARVLLAADLTITGSRGFDASTEALLARLSPSAVAQEIRTTSVVFFPKTARQRLVQVRAIDDQFPIYGQLTTDPPDALERMRREAGLIIEENLRIQLDLSLGDRIRVGSLELPIVGFLRSVPGEILATSYLGPRLYLPLPVLDETRLIGRGSIARFRRYLRLPSFSEESQEFLEIQRRLQDAGYQVDTVGSRVESIGSMVEEISALLFYAALTSLLIGALAVGGGISLYFRRKQDDFALLRCLGASRKLIFGIASLELLGSALLGILLGLFFGYVATPGISILLADTLPIPLHAEVGFPSVCLAIGSAFGGVTIATFAPLVRLSLLPPLVVFRQPFATERQDPRSLPFISGILGMSFLSALSLFLSPHLGHGFLFAAILGGSFLFLAGSTEILARVLQLSAERISNFAIRHGILSLRRPENQTLLVGTAIGFGVFGVLTPLFLYDAVRLENGRLGGPGEANLVLFDIQREQRRAVREALEKRPLPVLEDIPIVMMRISSINGRRASELEKGIPPIPQWTLHRDYGSTYRDHLLIGEEIVSGTFHGGKLGSRGEIGISLEEEMARRLNVALGDNITFNLHGEELPTRITSIRKVNWRHVQPNSFVVFPSGVLENAPQFFVMTTVVPNTTDRAEIARELSTQFPNVSQLDVALIRESIESVVNRLVAAAAIIVTVVGLAVTIMISTNLLLSRRERIRDGTRWLVLGVPRRVIRRMFTIEFFATGGIGFLNGCALALSVAWFLTEQVLEIPFVFSIAIARVGLVGVGTVGIALLLGRLLGGRTQDLFPVELMRSDLRL